MTPAFEHYAKITDREWVKDRFATLTADAANDFHKEHLPAIPAGTVIQCDFGGDFGLYAMADVDGVIHRVKIEVTDFHKIQFAAA